MEWSEAFSLLREKMLLLFTWEMSEEWDGSARRCFLFFSLFSFFLSLLSNEYLTAWSFSGWLAMYVCGLLFFSALFLFSSSSSREACSLPSFLLSAFPSFSPNIPFVATFLLSPFFSMLERESDGRVLCLLLRTKVATSTNNKRKRRG